jgi:diguanylate cyclase (GGDEF)-like protein
MLLDASTLTFAGSLVAFASGMFLLGHWLYERPAWPLLWWGAASLGMAVGIGLVAFDGNLPDLLSKAIGPLVLILSAVVFWIASRIFNRGRIALSTVALVVGAVLAVDLTIGAIAKPQLAGGIGILVAAGFYALATLDFWVARKTETLRARPAMLALLSLQAISLVLAAYEVSSAALYLPRPSLGFLGMIHFTAIVFLVGTSISLVSMLKERTEAKFKAAALVDPLTGLSNRRAFMEASERLFQASERDPKPISVLAFDLDRFKRINDEFGHATGDQVIALLADVLIRNLRPMDIVGRLGGEEFSAVLPGSDGQVALTIANRIRGTFQDRGQFLNGNRIVATVSVGVTTVAAGTLSEALDRADSALYRAKEMGRNRVAVADDGRAQTVHAKVVRIA